MFSAGALDALEDRDEPKMLRGIKTLGSDHRGSNPGSVPSFCVALYNLLNLFEPHLKFRNDGSPWPHLLSLF